MRTFTHSIFSFLLLIPLCLFVNQDVRAQWELLLKQEGQNWQYQDMQVGGDGGVLIIAQVENSYRLLRVNILGQVVWGFAFEELNLPDIEIINPTVQILTDGELLLSYGTDSLETHKRLAKLNPYGKLIWTSDLEFYGAVIEMESGDYLQIVSVEVENVSEEEERDIVATAINRENGSILWREVYATEADEEIWKRKWTSDGNYMIAGKSDENHIFTMLFSNEGEHIGGYTYDFEGEELDIPEGNDGYQLSDIDITSDDGLIVMRTFKIPDVFIYFNYPYLTLEKFDRLGTLEWSKTYGDDNDDNYNAWNSYGFNILQDKQDKQDKQGDYVIYGDFTTDFEILPNVGKASFEGDFLWDRAYYGLVYDDWYYRSNSSYLESLKNGNYLLFGHGNTLVDYASIVSRIPFAAKIDDTGKLKWGEFYDLGDENQNNLFFVSKANRCYNSQICYTASDVTNIHTEEDFMYIFSVNENGLKYENIINGEIFLDSNEDCERDESDNGLYSGIVVTIDSPQFTRYSFTDKNGRFSTELPINDYTISYSLDNELFAPSCNTNSYQISFTENYDTLTNLNFPLQAIVECPKLEVEIGTPLLRRCFKNTYKVSYCNKGTLAAEDAKITLEFPSEMIPLGSSIELALKEGQEWTFDLGKVEIGECGFFTVIDSISCEADLGSTICLKSRILPDDPCEAPSTLWDKSNIEVTGECLGEQVRFTLENVGSGNMSEERNFSVYENNVLTETGKIQLKSHERLQLHLNPNGKALRLKVEQSPHFPITEDEPQTTVEACGAGNYSYGYTNSTEQNDRPPSIDIDCQEIIGSFDPNDIQVYPTGITNQHFIEENTKLTYKIRFQNTGNDTAFRVMIVDTLPQGLEGASLNLGNSSHDYTFDIKFGNLLVWTFDNILLPDSTTNEPESHGFVQFSILPKADIELGAKIENKADIYFDFNKAVATNQVFNTIAEDLDLDYGTPLSLYILFIDFNTELLDNGNIKVDWVAINSNHISHFEVERSRNPYSFEMIQKVAPKEGESEAYIYEFEDEYEGNESVLYYRIKAIGVTGDYDYTLIRVVLLENNPAKYEVSSADKKQLLIEWIGERDETYTIRVFNIIGQQILDFNVSWFDSLMPHLDTGVYILQVFDSQDRMIKTKKVFGS